ncbi:hypothetical protein [Autumnicola musiva]|uniref:Uncharacterized protein n=1 Tax=Autumnicola musiva TaxID=3075589 RepID=A0ABU3D700_9FLAO|nr:hypothetical protein [Zunongwangia sp. F117]MDT0677311.1 hypothetical protein [Zunongwangia sp. F117]
MFQTNYGKFDPNSWEDTFQIVFKIVYKEEVYQKMPDSNGDLGIEGFTLKTGKAFQCYCPENNISGKELYEALRDKISRDIKKLETNCSDLKKILGELKIQEWYLVTPKNSDKKIYAHCRKKEREIISKSLEILDCNFKIIIHEIEDYVSYLKFSKNGIMYNPVIEDNEKSDWVELENAYVENAKRKYSKVFESDYEDLSQLEITVLKATDLSIERYLKGIKQIEFLKNEHPKDFERFTRIASQLEEDVAFDSLGLIVEKKVFIKKLTEKVEQKLREELEGFDSILLKDLANQMVSGWVLECSLNFI